MNDLSIIKAATVITPVGNNIEECVSAIENGKTGIRKPDPGVWPNEWNVPFLAQINWTSLGYNQSLNKSKSSFLFEKMLGDLFKLNPDTQVDAVIVMEISRIFCSIEEFFKKIYPKESDVDFNDISDSFDSKKFVQKSLNQYGIHLSDSNIHFLDNTCTSGISLIAFAKQAIEAGLWNHVLIVAIDLLDEYHLNYLKGLGALNTKATDVDFASTPFNKERNGFVKSEGGSMALISKANMNECHQVLSIKGFSQTNDAYRLTDGRDDAFCLSRSMKESIIRSKIKQQDVAFVKSHGTGTFLNDIHEASAILSTFSDFPSIPVTSLKGNLGHTTDASGLIESLIAGQAFLKHKILPTLNCHESDLGLNIVTQLMYDYEKKYFLSSSSGFGGCNASVIFEKII